MGVVLQWPEGDAARQGAKARGRVEKNHVLAPNVPLVVFASPNHPLATRQGSKGTNRSDLEGFTMYVSDSDGDFHTRIARFFVDGGLPTARLQSAGSVEGVKRGVLADPGALGILSRFAIEEELRRGGVVRLDVNPHPPAVQLVALMSPVRAHHPGAVGLVDGMRTALGPHASPTKPTS